MNRDRRRWWLTTGVVVAGMLALAVLLGARWLHVRTEMEDAAWLEAVTTLESDVAISHLWLEEHVMGDQVDLAEIHARLDRASGLIEALLGQAGARDGQLALRPVRDQPELAELRREVERLAASLDSFRQIAEDRLLGLERGLDVGVGSRFDIEYDAVFGRLLDHVQVLKAVLVDRREASRRRERKATYALAGAWVALVALSGAALWHRESRRLRAAAALEDSRRQLWRAQRTEAVGRLAGGLAHDLDNYLAAIRAQCELALRNARAGDALASTAVEAKLQTAIGVVDKASALLDRLLAFHRGAQIEVLQRVDLGASVRDLEPMIAAALGGSIELRLDLPADLWPVLADPVGLQQVVINLAVNARDAMPEGGTLRLRAHPLPAVSPGTEDRVRLEVADDGVGIDPEALERIFEPFWSTKGEADHSGLGLAIVDSVVHQMGGLVSVVSEPGRGTVFRIDLPSAGAPGDAGEHLGGSGVILSSSSGE